MPLVYEPNPKHKEPWQRGRKGTLCPHWGELDPAELLVNSVLFGEKRFATLKGMAFVAQQHHINGTTEFWHGYPEGWENIPPKIWRPWLKAGTITHSQMNKFWTRSSLGDED